MLDSYIEMTSAGVLCQNRLQPDAGTNRKLDSNNYFGKLSLQVQLYKDQAMVKCFTDQVTTTAIMNRRKRRRNLPAKSRTPRSPRKRRFLAILAENVEIPCSSDKNPHQAAVLRKSAVQTTLENSQHVQAIIQ